MQRNVIEFKDHTIAPSERPNVEIGGTMYRVEGPHFERPIYVATVRNAKLRITGAIARVRVGLKPILRPYSRYRGRTTE